MLPTLKIALYCLTPLTALILSATLSVASPPAEKPNYQLAISFDLPRNTLTGTARLVLEAGESLSLSTGKLTITGILLKRQDGSSHEVKVPESRVFTVPAETGPRELYISYTRTVSSDRDNLISDDGITLLSDWYPEPDRRMRYRLEAALPKGFTAVTEADRFPLQHSGGTVSAGFSQPLPAIHFAAAPYSINRREVRAGLEVYTLFFPEDADLASDYLRKAREYILRYEREIGPFPYAHYVIVANRKPTGLGMPTFTLLGQSVLRLPFIKDTSLGHEILHSWFGNSIDIDPARGNWCEALTSYLADHAYRQDQGEGAAYRKEAILNYLSYVHEDTVMPLSEFGDAGHAQPLAQARRAVGYSRGMMLFHELHERLGPERFATAIRKFYAEFRDRTASWDDLRKIFNSVSHDEDLSQFFAERLSRTDIPAFHAENPAVTQDESGSVLRFRLVQETDEPYQLKVPVRVTTAQGDSVFSITADSRETEVALPLPGRPLAFVLDPDYSLLRRLEPEERPAIWSQFLGSASKLVILESKEAERIYSPLLKQLQDKNWNIRYAGEVRNAELRDADLLLLGLNQETVRTLFGAPAYPSVGFTLDVRANPLNPDHVAVLISSSSPGDTGSAAPRLSHYGKYSYLHFEKNHPPELRITPKAAGMHYQLEQLPVGGPTAALSTFEVLASELAGRDIVYIGETHTSASDHRLQLRLIEAIAARVPDLAIGMEMFPESSQEALDRYIFKEPAMTEKEFLKASRYFTVWQYDYRFFREIFQFARLKKIPVIGLNLEKDTVSTVYKTGATDQLSPEVLNSLPRERDLDMPGYGRRLREMHAMHQAGNHGSGLASGFIQAQALWDETMATGIVKHLKEHPGRKMIILAGTQHTRKDSGIPPRVARRMTVTQASVLNIGTGTTPADVAEVADYFFLAEPAELAEAPKMGIILEEAKEQEDAYVKILDFTPESKAPAAGLMKGDIIRAVGGYPVSSMEDIRIAMVDAASADTTKVGIERGQGKNTKKLEVTVELIRLEGH